MEVTSPQVYYLVFMANKQNNTIFSYLPNEILQFILKNVKYMNPCVWTYIAGLTQDKTGEMIGRYWSVCKQIRQPWKLICTTTDKLLLKYSVNQL